MKVYIVTEAFTGQITQDLQHVNYKGGWMGETHSRGKPYSVKEIYETLTSCIV